MSTQQMPSGAEKTDVGPADESKIAAEAGRGDPDPEEESIAETNNGALALVCCSVASYLDLANDVSNCSCTMQLTLSICLWCLYH